MVIDYRKTGTNKMKVLVTGATGFIGSHTCVELINSGYEVVGIDNFVNSKPCVLERIKKVSGKEVSFFQGDITDKKTVESIFEANDISVVIHFAGLKAVGESFPKSCLSFAFLVKYMAKRFRF